ACPPQTTVVSTELRERSGRFARAPAPASGRRLVAAAHRLARHRARVGDAHGDGPERDLVATHLAREWNGAARLQGDHALQEPARLLPVELEGAREGSVVAPNPAA